MASLDIQALIAFIAVAETGSFSLAAEKLFLTQSAVSKRVAQLEQQLQTPVFDRVKRKFWLTEAGKALLPMAKQIIQSLKDTQQAISDIAGKTSGKLAIAFSHHIGLHRLGPHLKQFSSEHAEVNLDISFVDSDDGYARVLEGTSELAVITLFPEPRKDICVTPLWRDPLALVCSPEHPLHLRNNVSLEELSQLDMIFPGENTHTGNLIHQLFAQENRSLKTSMTTSNLETIKMMVSIGLGWSILPKTMIGELEQIHIPDTYLERQLGIIELQGRQQSNAANAFKTMLLKTASIH